MSDSGWYVYDCSVARLNRKKRYRLAALRYPKLPVGSRRLGAATIHFCVAR